MESSRDEHRRLWAALIVLLVWNVGMSMTLVGIFNDIEDAINDLRRQDPRFMSYKSLIELPPEPPWYNQTDQSINITQIDRHPEARP